MKKLFILDRKHQKKVSKSSTAKRTEFANCSFHSGKIKTQVADKRTTANIIKSRNRINKEILYLTGNAGGTNYNAGKIQNSESQGEIRTWENCTSGLIYGIKALPLVRSAFTIIELLFVIAIIIIIAGMLLPALKSARTKTLQITCMGNLKQVGVGLNMYLSDYNDKFFPSKYDNSSWWCVPLDNDKGYFTTPYLKMKPGFLSNSGNVLDCPANNEHWTSSTPYMNYAYNYMPYYYGGGKWYPLILASDCVASKLIMFADMTLLNESNPPEIGTSYCGTTYHWNNTASSRTDSLGKGISWCHSNGANTVYLDGHGAWSRKTDLSDENFEPVPGYTP